jgi:hypothetical protein
MALDIARPLTFSALAAIMDFMFVLMTVDMMWLLQL